VANERSGGTQGAEQYDGSEGTIGCGVIQFL